MTGTRFVLGVILPVLIGFVPMVIIDFAPGDASSTARLIAGLVTFIVVTLVASVISNCVYSRHLVRGH